MFRATLASLFSLALGVVLAICVSAELSVSSCNVTASDKRALAARASAMFDHAFSAYLTHASPADELRPLSCSPENSFKGLSITLIDTLDTLVILKQWSRFADAVRHLCNHLSFAVDDTVSVFETTIRAMGGLLSAHAFLTDHFDDTGFTPALWTPWYRGELLALSVDLADRLMPAFDSPTRIPYGSVNLMRGVEPDESHVASTAGAGSLLLEFGTISLYTADPRYYEAAFAAMRALHNRASHAGLVGNHIDILSGEWVAPEAGVGGSVDSFYEYMLKGYILFGDARLLRMFRESYQAIESFVHKAPWNLDANMWSTYTMSPTYSSLAAFWPGVQVLFGDVEKAAETSRAHYAVWKRYGCLPEGYDVVDEMPARGQVNYPLRPELVESLFYLHWATNDSSWVAAARAMMFSIEHLARVDCGYAAIRNVATHELEDVMPSFLLSETLKYLYLIFTDADENGKQHWLRSGNYVFTTEAHPLRIVTEGLRDVLGENFDDDTSAEGTSGLDPGNASRWPPRARKCKPLSELASKLPCGYNIPGTDHPKLDRNSLRSPSASNGITPLIAESVTQQLRKRSEQEGGGSGANVGDIIFGSGWACRVVQIEGQVVSFERLIEPEASLAFARDRMQRQQRMLTEVSRGKCKWSPSFHAALKTNVCWRRMSP